jgi:glycosyltransferase involved in cell wall biosynthesis
VVVEPGNARALADAVLQLRNSPDDRLQMGRRAREYVEEHFDRDQLVRHYADALEEATA